MIRPAAGFLALLALALSSGTTTAQRRQPLPTFAQPAPTALPSFRVSELHIVTAQPRLYFPGPVHIQVGAQTPVGPQQNGVWVQFDLTPWGVPPDARAVFLAGLLIITHGTRTETANLDIAFRAPGDTTAQCGNKIGQSVEAHVGGGQRQTMSLWVPVVDGLVEMCMTRSTLGQWPTTSAYAATFTIQAWAK
ncbi:MAG: hypothetical protein KGP27_04325 [Hyphomicrobiales bacterium]|nr:hypothetical protein [Hyphomicrobiales bacterium]